MAWTLSTPAHTRYARFATRRCGYRASLCTYGEGVHGVIDSGPMGGGIHKMVCAPMHGGGAQCCSSGCDVALGVWSRGLCVAARRRTGASRLAGSADVAVVHRGVVACATQSARPASLMG
ncbi:hypothetical protein E2562_015189 [Oryza meyeriana var. granulata]|uniref:Uncharacterized protein n=1 Tax=Oryza meyeriana var. granulata TaxID=110450 RepID=A0A6G1EWR0_9ORYZ|nr:hypothetical protein E2562_015189 [Oryza meyeriana var. granulata]